MISFDDRGNEDDLHGASSPKQVKFVFEEILAEPVDRATREVILAAFQDMQSEIKIRRGLLLPADMEWTEENLLRAKEAEAEIEAASLIAGAEIPNPDPEVSRYLLLSFCSHPANLLGSYQRFSFLQAESLEHCAAAATQIISASLAPAAPSLFSADDFEHALSSQLLGEDTLDILSHPNTPPDGINPELLAASGLSLFALENPTPELLEDLTGAVEYIWDLKAAFMHIAVLHHGDAQRVQFLSDCLLDMPNVKSPEVRRMFLTSEYIARSAVLNLMHGCSDAFLALRRMALERVKDALLSIAALELNFVDAEEPWHRPFHGYETLNFTQLCLPRLDQSRQRTLLDKVNNTLAELAAEMKLPTPQLSLGR